MKIKCYTGTSRPLGEIDKRLLEIIGSNLNHFNANKRKGILSVEHYVDGGDKWKVLKDGKTLICGMTLMEIYYTVAGIITYTMEVR